MGVEAKRGPYMVLDTGKFPATNRQYAVVAPDDNMPTVALVEGGYAKAFATARLLAASWQLRGALDDLLNTVRHAGADKAWVARSIKNAEAALEAADGA